MIFKLVEDESKISANKIVNIFAQATKASAFRFSDDFKEELKSGTQALVNFKGLLDFNVPYDDAYAQTIAVSTERVKAYVAEHDVAKESIQDFIIQERKSAVAVAAQNTSLKNCSSIIKTFNSGLSSLGMSQEDFIAGVQKSNPVLAKYLSGIKDGKGSLAGYVVQLGLTKAATIGLEMATMALNTAITMGVGFVVSKVISWLQEVYVTEEELAEKVKEVTDAYNERKKSLRDNKSTLDSLASEYEKLSKGVDDLGRNESLTNEQFDRYNEIANQIGEMFPTLITGYTDTGTAILSCKDNVEALTQAYENQVIAANNAILTNGGNILDDFKNDSAEFDNDVTYDYSANANEAIKKTLEAVENGEDWLTAIRKYMTSNSTIAGQIEKMFTKELGHEKRGEDTWWKTIDDETQNTFFRRVLQEGYQGVISYIDEYDAKIADATKETKGYIEGYIENSILRDSSFDDLAPAVTQIASNFASTLDYAFLKQFAGKENKAALDKYLDDFLNGLLAMSEEAQQAIDYYFVDKLQFDSGKIGVGEFVDSAQQAQDAIAGIKDDATRTAMEQSVDFSDANKIIEQSVELIESLVQRGASKEVAQQFIDGLIGKDFQIAVEMYPKLSDEQIENEINQPQWHFTAGLNGRDVDDLTASLEEYKKATDEIKPLSLSELLIDDEKNDSDFHSLIDGEIERVQYLQDMLEKARSGELQKGTLDYSNLIAQYGDIDSATSIEDGIAGEIKKLWSDGIKPIINEMREQVAPEDLPLFDQWVAGLESVYVTAEEGKAVFATLGDAMDGVGSTSGLLANLQKEMDSAGQLSLDSVKQIYDIFGEDTFEKDFITFDGDKPIANIDAIRDYYIQAIRDMELEDDKLEESLIEALDADIDQYNFDQITEARKQAQEIAKLAAETKDGITWDQEQQYRDLFGERYNEFIIRDADGNALRANTTLMQMFAQSMALAGDNSEAAVAAFEEMWAAAEEAVDPLEKYSDALDKVNAVSDYKTLVASDDLKFSDALSSALKLLEDMPEHSLEDFFSIDDAGEVTYHTEHLTTWIEKYIDEAVDAGDITEQFGDKMKEAAAAETEQTTALETLTDAMGKVQNAASLITSAQEEIAKSGKNSLDTISDLYSQFGEDAAGMLKPAEGGGVIIDVDAVKEKLFADIEKATDDEALQAVMKASLEVELDTGAFDSAIDDHVSKINTLQDALEKVRSGEMDDSALFALADEFPELATETGNLEEAIVNLLGSMNTDVIKKFDEQIAKCTTEEAREQLIALRDIVVSLGQAFGSILIDIDVETAGFEKLYDAVEESAGATGLSVESIDALINRYKDLHNYNLDELFENTSTGIHLNTKAANKLEQEYQLLQKLKLQKTLLDLEQEYRNTRMAVLDLEEGTAEYNAALGDMREADAILTDIERTQTLISQYDGLTSAYNRWQQAKATPDVGSQYDEIRNEKKNIDDLAKQGAWGSDDLRSWIDLIKPEDMMDSGASAADYKAAYESFKEDIKGTSFSVNDFFADGAKGPENFVKALSQLNSDWAKFDKKTGQWTLNGSAEEWASSMGVSIEFVQSMMDKLRWYGFDGLTSDVAPSMQELQEEIETTESKLKALGVEPIEIDVTNAEESTNTCKSTIEDLEGQIDDLNNDSTIDPDVKTEQLNLLQTQLADAQLKLKQLIYSTNQPQFMSINTSQVDSDLQGLLEKFQRYGEAVNELNYQKELGADTSAAQAEVDALAQEIAAVTDKEALAKIGIEFAEGMDIESIKAEIAAASFPVNLTPTLEGLQDKDISIVTSIVGMAGVQALQEELAKLQDKDVTAVASIAGMPGVQALNQEIADLSSKTVDIVANVSGTKAVQSLKAAIDSLYSKTVNTYHYKYTYEKTVAGANGTANAFGSAFARGTTGLAFKKGDWGIQGSGEALGGELGQELVVRDGKYFTIGDNGAEFFRYRPGDIVFNHLQTRAILANGKIGSRGKALADGTALASGTIYSNWIGSFGGSSSDSSSKKTSSSSKKTGSSNKTEKNATEIVDWIEVAIARIEHAIEHFSTIASSAFLKLTKRMGASATEIQAVSEELDLQEQAYERYIEEAEKVNLSADIKALVREGTIDITKYSKNTKDLIDSYQEWYYICSFIWRQVKGFYLIAEKP